jgi:hypothetical protein
MSGNYPYFQVTDVTAVHPTIQNGKRTTVTVSFFCKGDPQAEWYCDKSWPFTAKVYLEGFGTRPERQWTASGNLAPGQGDYEMEVEVGPLNLEGVYAVGALVELDDDAGFVMGHYDGDLKLSIWTKQ